MDRLLSLFPEQDIPKTFKVQVGYFDQPLVPRQHYVGTSRFGFVSTAECEAGLCAMAFGDSPVEASSHVLKRYPHLPPAGSAGQHTAKALNLLEDPLSMETITLAVTGTAFQRSVWSELLLIPFGATTNYGALSLTLSIRHGGRAVGNAAGANPVAFFIPCHRLVNSAGNPGHFRWGAARKVQMLHWEKELMGQWLNA